MSGTKDNFSFVGLDTNIFIYYFDQNPEFGSKSKVLFDKLTEGSLQAVTSTIALIEILSHKILTAKEVREMEDKFYNIPRLVVEDVDRSMAIIAAEIRREYGFRTPDAIQLATAVNTKAEAFVTNDDRFKKFKEIRIITLNEARQKED